MSEVGAVSDEDCIASWCAGDDWCAITCTMAVIGRKWHPAIVHQLLEDGPLRFNELSGTLGPITNKMLSESLENLQESNVIERRVSPEQPVEVHYALTERGRSLESVIRSLAAWGSTHLPGHSREEPVE